MKTLPTSAGHGEIGKTAVLGTVCLLLAIVVMLSATVWNYGGTWSNFDFEYHFKTIQMMQETGRYPLQYEREYGVGFYPPLSHIIVRWFILYIEHPSLTVAGSQARPWTEMFTLNSFVNALQVIPLFLAARRFGRSNLAGVSACLLIIVNGFQTWPVMGPFPDMYGLVFLSFAVFFMFEGDLGGIWAAPKYVLAGVFLVCAGFTHPLSYVFAVTLPFTILIGRLGYRLISRQRPLLKSGDWILLILGLISLIVPAESYYLKADPSGLILHTLYPPEYTNPWTRILFDPWLLTSLGVISYSLWRRKAGGFVLGAWLLLPFILVEFNGLIPPYTWILRRYITYGQLYFTQPQAILLGSGVAFLLQEATAKGDSRMVAIRIRLALVGLIASGALLKAGQLVMSQQTTTVAASFLRLLQGTYDFPMIIDMMSTLLYLCLGVSVCIFVELSALRYLVPRLKQRLTEGEPPKADQRITR